MKAKQTQRIVVLSIIFFLIHTGSIIGNSHQFEPNTILEAQLMALELSGELVPPVELTEQIYNDLQAIRTAYPEKTNLYYTAPYAPNQMMVGLTDQAMADFRNGQYHALNELNELYGVVSISDYRFINLILLTFDKIYNMELLSDIYENSGLEGIRYAEPNHRIGDFSTIYAIPPFYTFRHAWGDCPAGCIYQEFFYFHVENGKVKMNTGTYSGGTGKSNNPYRITNPLDLMIIKYQHEDKDKYFELTNDINLTKFQFKEAVIAPYGETLNWKGAPFCGVFNGNGYTIKNLTIKGGESSSYLGLFGINEGTIKNLNIENCNITCGDNSELIGCLCGIKYGNIINCSVNGSVHCGKSQQDIGGLCGRSYSGSLTNSYFIGTIYAGDYSRNIGGLCGNNQGTISNCYSCGNVNQEYHSGRVGGLCGRGFSSSISYCYFLDPNNGGGPNNGLGTALTNSQMKKQSSFIGWDFVFETKNGTDDIWMIYEGVEFPKFRCQNTLPVAVADLNKTYGIWPSEKTVEVTFDGSKSYDPDGDLNNLTYSWTWSEDCNSFEANEPIFSIDMPIGQYNFELIVSDGIDKSEPNAKDINVLAPLKTQARFFPQIIKRRNKWPRYFMGFIKIPKEIQIENISDNPILLENKQGGLLLEAYSKIIFEGKDKSFCIAFFKKNKVLEALDTNGKFKFTIITELKTGQYIFGKDIIKITNRYR